LCDNKGVRHALILALTICVPCAAQVIVNPIHIQSMIGIFDPQPGDRELRCEVTPIHPALNFGFRFQAGYRVTVSASQFAGKGHAWSVLVRVTPLVSSKPVYLVSGQRLAEIPKTTMQLQFGGGYLLGEGAYDVNWVMLDDQERICRKTWRVDVHRSHAEHSVKVAMPPDTVWDVSLRGARLLPRNTDDAASIRLSILLNAAPLFARRTRIRPGDIGTLISAVSSLLERVPVRRVRLVVFNLEQQKELYRNGNFMLKNMPDVAQAMNSIDLNTVDYEVLKNRGGHVDLLAGLINQEIHENPPSDVVLCLGPMSRFTDRVPTDLIEKQSGPAPRFVNVELLPGPFMQSTLPDIIRNAVSRVGGRTMLVHTPGEFARAIERLEKP